MRARGFTAIEMLVVLAIVALLLAIRTPLSDAFARERIRSAGAESAITFRRARLAAIRTCRETAVRVEQNPAAYRLAVYTDGNRNGVRNTEIASGIDRPAGLALNWIRGDVRPGFLRNVRIPDPSNPGHYLDRLNDPVRFNGSNLCSFSPISTATPGSLYLTDGRREMAVLRVNGQMGRIHLLYYTAGDRQWRP